MPGDVGEDEEEGERELGDDQRKEHAPVIMGEPDRRRGQTALDQQPVHPALRPEIGQQPFGDQHRSQRDRQDEDRGQDALPRAVAPHAEGDRQREPDIDEGRRDREREGRRDRVVEERLREEAEIVGEPAALLRLERQHEAVEERVDEEQQHEQHPRHSEERGPVEPALSRDHRPHSRAGRRGRARARPHNATKRPADHFPRAARVDRSVAVG